MLAVPSKVIAYFRVGKIQIAKTPIFPSVVIVCILLLFPLPSIVEVDGTSLVVVKATSKHCSKPRQQSLFPKNYDPVAEDTHFVVGCLMQELLSFRALEEAYDSYGSSLTRW